MHADAALSVLVFIMMRLGVLFISRFSLTVFTMLFVSGTVRVWFGGRVGLWLIGNERVGDEGDWGKKREDDALWKAQSALHDGSFVVSCQSKGNRSHPANSDCTMTYECVWKAGSFSFGELYVDGTQWKVSVKGKRLDRVLENVFYWVVVDSIRYCCVSDYLITERQLHFETILGVEFVCNVLFV